MWCCEGHQGMGPLSLGRESVSARGGQLTGCGGPLVEGLMPRSWQRCDGANVHVAESREGLGLANFGGCPNVKRRVLGQL
jgi:hypothetical protein